MKRSILLSIMLMMGLIFFSVSHAQMTGEAKVQAPDLSRLPLHFIPNRGQLDPQAHFYAQAGGYTLWITKEGLVFDKPAQKNGEKIRDISRLIFVDANPNPEIIASGMMDHRVHYFRGKDPKKWKTDVPTSKAVLFREIYKHIDLQVYGVAAKIEYDWIIKPGGNPDDIRIQYREVTNTTITTDGDLLIKTATAQLRHRKPVSYQEIDGKRVTVNAVFKKLKNNTFGLEVGSYDKKHELVIDPLVLVYGSYLGGKFNENVTDMTADNHGNVYLVGTTTSAIFPSKNPYMEYGETFVSKLEIKADGSSILRFSSFVGGLHPPAGTDNGYGIAVDNNGMIYVAGYTDSAYFPLKNQYQRKLQGTSDAFIVKLDPSKSASKILAFSTYFGGTGDDTAFDIAVDGDYVYITGETDSKNFPVRNGYNSNLVNAFTGYKNAFITKLDTGQSGNDVLVYSSYLASYSVDSGRHIAVDNSGNAYVTGTTKGDHFPFKNGYSDTYFGPVDFPKSDPKADIFLTRIDTTKTWAASLIYSTYFGGENADYDGGVAVDNNGNAYITGYTRSPNFPIRNAFRSYFLWSVDAFVSKINTNASGDTSLVFSTFLGGSGSVDEGQGIAVNSAGEIYISGHTDSTDFPILNPLQAAPAGKVDNFLTKFDSSGTTLMFSTFLGGFVDDHNSGMALDSENNIYLAGNTISSDFPTTAGAFQPAMDDRMDAFVVKLTDDQTTPPPADTPEVEVDRNTLVFGGTTAGMTSGMQQVRIDNCGTGNLNWTASDDQTWLSCSPASGTNSGALNVTVSQAGLPAGTHTGKVVISDPNASNSPYNINVTFHVYQAGASATPFGYFDTPDDGSTVMSSIPVTGWALDGVGIASVKIYRQEGSSDIYIGDALMVEGARPDVETAFPAYPNCNKAGWGYMLLTNFLPNGDSGSYELLAKAVDIEGNETILGTKTITCDNLHAVKPFGAIDTPYPGEITSGMNYVNFGWALTPLPNSIATDGSTIDVWVDGKNLGHPVYNQYRSDIATVFPGYANSNGAVGYFYFDTTDLDNGVHTIQWTATDSADNTDGIGSRYFTVQNNAQNRSSGASLELNPRRLPQKGFLVDAASPVGITKGYKDYSKESPQQIYPDENGFIKAEIKELERIVLHFGTGEPIKNLEGWQLVGQQYRPLPPGSFMDIKNNSFCWQPGPAFVREYRFLFLETNQDGDVRARNVLINIVPKY
jgi:beta-propeller repeat-containing protein/BACON domain-containing protein